MRGPLVLRSPRARRRRRLSRRPSRRPRRSRPVRPRRHQRRPRRQRPRPPRRPRAPRRASFNVWFSANWNDITDKAVGDTFVEWGATKNLKVEWQSIPGSPQQLAKESAALAAGQPPELNNDNRTYWYSQGEMADLKELVNKFKDQAGGMYEIGISSNAVADGAIIGAPYAIDVWPAHWRMDLIGPANGRPLLRDLGRADPARPEGPAAAQDVHCTPWRSATRATT